jgi:glycosyltransferase involved in cell wall biosynthesis
MISITAVIPTRNRETHLRSLLSSLQRQTLSLSEIIIVDSSDDTFYQKDLSEEYHELNPIWLSSLPSVCAQRNMGIQNATNEWVFLCDDDIELPEDYIQKISEFILSNPAVGAVAGQLRQLEDNRWQHEYPVTHTFTLFFRFIFQLPVWGRVDGLKSIRIFQPLVNKIQRWYRVRGNDLSLAGWPLITQWHGDVMRTKVYSLGANVIRRQWLLESPYDELLDPNGIGDNYGVALNFPDGGGVWVLASTFALHHRAIENRLSRENSYYKRIMALHYFIRKSPEKFQQQTVLWFIWSLVGNTILFLVKRNFGLVGKSLKAIADILFARNPYLLASTSKLRS